MGYAKKKKKYISMLKKHEWKKEKVHAKEHE
jgi:hypothetical protein